MKMAAVTTVAILSINVGSTLRVRGKNKSAYPYTYSLVDRFRCHASRCLSFHNMPN